MGFHLNFQDGRFDAEFVPMGDHIDPIVAHGPRRMGVIAHGAEQIGDEMLQREAFQVSLDLLGNEVPGGFGDVAGDSRLGVVLARRGQFLAG